MNDVVDDDIGEEVVNIFSTIGVTSDAIYETLTQTAIIFIVIFGTHYDSGYSISHRLQDNHGNYKFGYNIKDKEGGENSREEKGGPHGGVVGSYSLHTPKGGKRIVHYVADKQGFRAHVDTNEPGTGHQDAADAIYNGVDNTHGYNNDNQHNYHQSHNDYSAQAYLDNDNNNYDDQAHGLNNNNNYDNQETLINL
ncbi:GATA zinc finger domain-containing protein 14-like [Oppia nitens]|uniref:GATA zinc finger domain-containing protein 14-like n=1 Tax=Oppia nitens TaxID=1686743 RepID=UPI0023DBF926|nr:GATA zinc finger domain-containing protein 14-like [Oppia nitens]